MTHTIFETSIRYLRLHDSKFFRALDDWHKKLSYSSLSMLLSKYASFADLFILPVVLTRETIGLPLLSDAKYYSLFVVYQSGQLKHAVRT